MTLAQAKARLRSAAAEAELPALAAPMEPHRAMLLALLAGVLVGSAPRSRRALAKVLVGLLFD